MNQMKYLLLPLYIFIITIIFPLTFIEIWKIIGLDFGTHRYWIFTYGIFDCFWGQLRPFEMNIFLPFDVNLLLILAQVWLFLGLCLSLNIFLVSKKAYRISIGVIISILVLITQIVLPFLICPIAETGLGTYITSILPIPIQSIISIIWLVLLKKEVIHY